MHGWASKVFPGLVWIDCPGATSAHTDLPPLSPPYLPPCLRAGPPRCPHAGCGLIAQEQPPLTPTYLHCRHPAPLYASGLGLQFVPGLGADPSPRYSPLSLLQGWVSKFSPGWVRINRQVTASTESAPYPCCRAGSPSCPRAGCGSTTRRATGCPSRSTDTM